jgi:hypothetical protein
MLMLLLSSVPSLLVVVIVVDVDVEKAETIVDKP